MTALLIAAEVAVIAAAIVGTVWLKRVADRAWLRHRALELAAEIRAGYVRLQIQVRDELTPALQRMAAAVAAMAPAMQRLGEAMKREVES